MSARSSTAGCGRARTGCAIGVLAAARSRRTRRARRAPAAVLAQPLQRFQLPRPRSRRRRASRCAAGRGASRRRRHRLAGGADPALCMPRILGYVFNPLSIYFCYRRDGALAALLYEVHNTFGERHSYLFRSSKPGGTSGNIATRFLRLALHGDEDALRFRVAPPAADFSVVVIYRRHARTAARAASPAAARRLSDARAVAASPPSAADAEGRSPASIGKR